MPLRVSVLSPMAIALMAPVRSWIPPMMRLIVMGSNCARAGAASENTKATPTMKPTNPRKIPGSFMRLLYSDPPIKHQKSGTATARLDALHSRGVVISGHDADDPDPSACPKTPSAAGGARRHARGAAPHWTQDPPGRPLLRSRALHDLPLHFLYRLRGPQGDARGARTHPAGIREQLRHLRPD